MTYQDSLTKLSEDVHGRLKSVLERAMDGQLDDFEMRALMAAVVAVGRVEAASLADAALAAELTRLWRRFVPAIGLDDVDPQEDAENAVAEALEGDGWKRDAAAAVAVLGRSQVMETAQDTYQRGMREQGVEYWTRDVEPDACEMCQDLATGILPTSTQMIHHKGCGCTQRPFDPKKED